MNKKNFLKGILISISSLVVGYFAISIPFSLFTNFTKEGTRLFFIIELAVYLVVGSIFLVAKDKQEQREKAQEIRHQERLAKIQDVKENWYNIAA